MLLELSRFLCNHILVALVSLLPDKIIMSLKQEFLRDSLLANIQASFSMNGSLVHCLRTFTCLMWELVALLDLPYQCTLATFYNAK